MSFRKTTIKKPPVQHRGLNIYLAAFSITANLNLWQQAFARLFRVTDAPAGVPAGPALIGRNLFLTFGANMKTETIESFGTGAVNPTLTFGGGNSCATSGVVVRSAPSLGRFNTTSGGNNYLEYTGYCSFTFALPICGFGAYITDMGDFNSTDVAVITDINGCTQEINLTGSITSGSLVFWGFGVSGGKIVKVEFKSTSSVFIAADFTGIDDLLIYNSPNVGIGVNEVAGGNTATTCLSHRVFHRFDHLAGLNTFVDVGAEKAHIVWTDSVANSAASGTFTNQSRFNLGAYQMINGNNITGNYSINGPWIWVGNIGNNSQDFTVDFWFSRQGAPVGGGVIADFPQLFTLSINGANGLTIVAHTDDGGALVDFTLNGAIALPLNSYAHVRAQVSRLVDPNNVNPDRVKMQIWIGGVVDAGSDSTVNAILTLGYSIEAPSARIGGLSGANYCPGIIDEFAAGTGIYGVYGTNFTITGPRRYAQSDI